MTSEENKKLGRLEAIRLNEKKLLQEIPHIDSREFKKIIGSPQFKQHIAKSLRVFWENGLGKDEVGFKVIRSLSSGEYSFSQVKTGSGMSVDLNDASFPDYPDNEKGIIDTTPDGKIDRDRFESWDAIDVVSIHWHPWDSTGSASLWFDSSSFDQKQNTTNGTLNALKIRSKSGLPADQLRSANPAEGSSEEDVYLRDIQRYYGYFINGMFAKNRMLQAEAGTIEAEFRPFDLIAMSVSEKKTQILVLRDNPNLQVNKATYPSVFSSPGHDLEDYPEECQAIVDYYRTLGFDAAILFTEIQDSGELEIRPYSSMVNAE